MPAIVTILAAAAAAMTTPATTAAIAAATSAAPGIKSYPANYSFLTAVLVLIGGAVIIAWGTVITVYVMRTRRRSKVVVGRKKLTVSDFREWAEKEQAIRATRKQ